MTRRSYLWNRFYGRFGSTRRSRESRSLPGRDGRRRDVQRLDPDWDRIRRELLAGQPNDALPHRARSRPLRATASASGDGASSCGSSSASRIRSSPTFRTARMIHMVSHHGPRHDARIFGRGQESSGGTSRSWLHSAALASANLASAIPDRYRIIHCETLAARPTETVGDLSRSSARSYYHMAVADAVRLDPIDRDDCTRPWRHLWSTSTPAATLGELGYEREAEIAATPAPGRHCRRCRSTGSTMADLADDVGARPLTRRARGRRRSGAMARVPSSSPDWNAAAPA